ncbi:MAG: sulfite exporter TauE/SafE family protein [Psychroflexus sp.]|nr:sulfite exporter TauE/SafE family protein [Psychroflexus sp.]MDN6309646.1 sulfite exporter TauE/SafE family protein [Psychroflexus sp.]
MPSEILIPILLICISLLISLFGSIVGFGGGIFMVPILITVFNFKLDVAVGAAMISLIPSSLVSTYLNRKDGNVDFKMGILLEIPTMVGVVLGSFLLSYISAKRLEVLFAAMVIFLGITFFIKKRKNDNEEQGVFYRLNKLKPRFIIKNSENFVAYRVSLYMALFFGMISGTLAGLFGVGGGFMKTPIMLKVFKIPAKIAAATALFMIVITSITGSISHAYQGHIVLNKAWPVLVGFTLGALAGHQVNTRIEASTLEKMIGFALIAAGLMMVSNFVMQG